MMSRSARPCPWCIDKQGIVNGIYKGTRGGIQQHDRSRMKQWYNDKLPPIVVDVAKAKQLLKDHGYEWDAQGKLMYPAGKTETLTARSEAAPALPKGMGEDVEGHAWSWLVVCPACPSSDDKRELRMTQWRTFTAIAGACCRALVHPAHHGNHSVLHVPADAG